MKISSIEKVERAQSILNELTKLKENEQGLVRAKNIMEDLRKNLDTTERNSVRSMGHINHGMLEAKKYERETSSAQKSVSFLKVKKHLINAVKEYSGQPTKGI